MLERYPAPPSQTIGRDTALYICNNNELFLGSDNDATLEFCDRMQLCGFGGGEFLAGTVASEEMLESSSRWFEFNVTASTMVILDQKYLPAHITGVSSSATPIKQLLRVRLPNDHHPALCTRWLLHVSMEILRC